MRDDWFQYWVHPLALLSQFDDDLLHLLASRWMLPVDYFLVLLLQEFKNKMNPQYFLIHVIQWDCSIDSSKGAAQPIQVGLQQHVFFRPFSPKNEKKTNLAFSCLCSGGYEPWHHFSKMLFQLLAFLICAFNNSKCLIQLF